MLTDTPNAQLLGLMLAEANDARSVRVEIPLLGCELPVRTGEQQLVRDEALQFLDVGSELRSAQARLERDNLRIWIADEDSFLRDASGSGYRSR